MSEVRETNSTAGMASDFGQRWTWLIDIVFGGIVVFAFENLEETLVAAIDTSIQALLSQLWLAACLLAFLVYDVAVYHLLTTKRPFRPTFLSACRYGLDIAMTLALAMIVIPPLSGVQASRTGITLLVSVTLWHLSAAAWHVLAAAEAKASIGPKAIGPHFAAILAYWLLFLVLSIVQIDAANSHITLFVLSGAMLLFSLWRAPQIIRLYAGVNSSVNV